ncbi:hypothetical protein AURDEDRAFT_149517 [Auricularia subglabra TFB-10046 SS5]|nr:hypothetical protein AURDEDRAFT_149517 [Auricularia subglabra TFB-10046 SS5]
MAADILFNSPALHSLKREQLVRLCKKHGIKASGKNVDLVDKLKAYAASLPPEAREAIDSGGGNTTVMLGDGESTSSVSGDEDQGNVTMQDDSGRPSQQWELLQEVRVLDDLPAAKSASLTSSKRANLQVPNEFGTDNSGIKSQSSVGSSIKSFASSLVRAGSVLGLNKSASVSSSSSLRNHLMPMDIDEGNTSLVASAKEYDADSLALPPSLCNESAPPDDPDAPPTIRLVSGQSVSWGSATPALKPVAPSFQLAEASPLANRLKPTVEQDEDDGQMPGAFPTPTHSRLAPPSPSRTPSTRRSPIPSPFVFGSPENKVTNAQFHTAANAVLQEMNRRMGTQGTSAALNLDILSKDKPAAPQPSASMAGRTKNDTATRFARAHEAAFDNMDSILNHYAAKRTSPVIGGKRKLESDDEDNGKRLFMSVEDDDRNRSPKRQRVQVAEPAAKPEVVIVNERQNIKKKLEMSRAKRRSSRGRVSVGPTAPVKGGLMSTTKSFVGRLWGRGPAAKPEVKPAPKPSTLVKPPPAAKTAKPALGPVSRPSTLTTASKRAPSVRSSSATSQPQGLGRKVSSSSKAADTSMSSVRSPTVGKTSIGSRASVQPRPQSRVLAPTASSLAKMQNPVRVSSVGASKSPLASVREAPPPVPPLPKLAPITNTPAATPAASTSDKPEPVLEKVVVKPGLAPRRPRISRSKVVAKLAEKRTASQGQEASIGFKHARRSLAAKERVADKRLSIEHAARRRIRQSELHRKG